MSFFCKEIFEFVKLSEKVGLLGERMVFCKNK